MSEKNEINDNEIRVIEGKLKEPEPSKESMQFDLGPEPPRWRRPVGCLFTVLLVAAALLGGVLVLGARSCKGGNSWSDTTMMRSTEAAAHESVDGYAVMPTERPVGVTNRPSKGYTEIIDTVIDGRELTLYIPHNAVPMLAVGVENYADTTCVMMMQAADIRGDNGEINCAFVLQGQLLARGERKAGYCAIIDGKATVGVERYSPLLEQAIEKCGDFFRQYPLVAGGQPVTNTLKSRSLRRALVQTDGTTMVVMTKDRVSLDEFAELLAALGAEQAIYLTGGTAVGKAKLKDGSRLEMGERHRWDNINFIIWR